MASMNRGYYTVYGRLIPVTTVLFLACGWAILVAPDGNLIPYTGDPRALLLPAIAWAFFTWRALTSGAFVLPEGEVRLRRLFSTVVVDADHVANCEVSDVVAPFGYIPGLTRIYGARVKLKDGKEIEVPAIFGKRSRVERVSRALLTEIRSSRP